MSDDILLLNKGLESKTSKSGKQAFHIKVESETLAFDLDTRKLAKPIADAIAHHIREKIRTISATASPATQAARKVAAKAFAEGKQWAMKRYSGGRMGPRAPNQSDRMFNDSGRFIESIIAQPASDGTFRINVAGNRLDPNTASGGAAAVGRIWARLVQLVPEIQDVARIMASDDVLRAQTRAVQGMIVKMKKNSGEGLLELAKAAIGVAKTARDNLNNSLAA